MHVLTRDRLLVETRTTPPGTPWGDVTPPTNSMIPGAATGVRITDSTAMGIPAFWACVGVLSDGVSTLPLRQYRGDPLKVKAATPMDPSPLILQPWAEETLIDFLGGGQVSLTTRGNFFGEVIDRNRVGLAQQIQPYDPDSVSIRRNGTTGAREYRVRTQGGGTHLIPSDDVVHIKNIKRSGALAGLNPIENLRLTLGLARAAEEYGASFFANGAIPLGVLEVPGDLGEDQTLKMARSWLQAHQGANKANLPAVLTAGTTFRETAFNLEDLQFIESRQLSDQQIAMIFRIPPHMISQVDRTTSWGTGVEQQFLGFVRFTLGGYLRRWEEMFSALLPAGQFAKFDLRHLLRPDSVQRAAIIVALRNAGLLSANEARDIYEDLGPIPTITNPGPGDHWLQPLNMGEAGVPPTVTTPGGSKSAGDHGFDIRELETIAGSLRALIAELPPLATANGNH